MTNPERAGDRERNPAGRRMTIVGVAAAATVLTFVPAAGQWLKSDNWNSAIA